MKTGFDDPIAPRKQPPKTNNKSLWNFEAPHYDRRSGDAVSAGCDYGTGFRTPVGKMQASGKSKVPTAKIKTMKIYEDRQ
jgi:hypothetical protein